MQDIQENPSWETHFQWMQKQGMSAEKVDHVLADVVGHYNKAIDKANSLEGYHYTANGNGGRRGNFGFGSSGSDKGRAGGGFNLKHIPCEDFLNGHCRYGDRCRKNHFE